MDLTNKEVAAREAIGVMGFAVCSLITLFVIKEVISFTVKKIKKF